MDNSVFISYRRSVSKWVARAVFQDLRTNDLNVFMDVESIDAGKFDTILLNQIASRPYFLLILTPGTLDRCIEPGDWLLHEIQHAVKLGRNIVPLVTNEFSYEDCQKFLPDPLNVEIPRWNSVNMPYDFFEEAMNRLRTRFLKPIDLLLTPISQADQVIVESKLQQAIAEPAVTEKQLTAQEFFERALTRAKDDLDGQIADYSEAIRLNPEFADAYNNRAIAYQTQDDFDNALADYTEAIRLNPSLPEAYSNRGVAHYDTGNFDAAIANYLQAMHLNPKYISAYRNLGNAYYRKGDLDKAIFYYTEAIRLDSRYAEAYYNRGCVYMSKGDLDAAFADFNKTLSLNSEHANAYYNRGNLHLAQKDFKAALADYSEAIRLNPQDAGAYNNRAWVYYLNGDYDIALPDCDRAIQLNPNKWVYYHTRGSVYAAQEAVDRALADYHKALDLNPDDRNAQAMRDYISKHEVSTA